MSTRKKLFFVVGGMAAALLAAILIVVYLYQNYHVEESPLYQAVSVYRENGEQGWEAPQDFSYPSDSGEGLFLRGMDGFAEGNYATAGEWFEMALTAPASDPALPACLYYYINRCGFRLTGTSEPETVTLALEAARGYPPLANDTTMLWELISSISLSDGWDLQAIDLLEEYLEDTRPLKLSTWAWLKNCIAMLEYNREEYAKSIRLFYDVELALENAKMTPELEIELRFAKEYIANINYIFEDYEKAAGLYRQLIDNTPAEGVFHAYGCCINMASAYLESGNVEKAREAMDILSAHLSRIEEAVLLEVEASMNDVLANICIQEGKYDEADSYLKLAEGFYRQGAGEAFLGGEHFVTLTRCKYLIHTGGTEQAQSALEQLIEDGNADYYNMEQDVYELLAEIHQKSGDTEQLAAVYKKLLELDVEFSQTTQREYLAFSEYYRENNQLKERNTSLSFANVVTTLVIIVISVILAAVLLLAWLLRAKNVTDQLTGVFNRKKLTQLSRTYKRTGTPASLGVVMMDIDYFKRYNDTYGHPAGDGVLKEVANVLKTSVRGKDVVIRYGGEEFLVLLSDLRADTAEAVCQRIHEQLKKRAIPHAASEVSEYVTLSMGLCHQARTNSETLETLIGYADECLYQSKESGRNRVTVKALP